VPDDVLERSDGLSVIGFYRDNPIACHAAAPVVDDVGHIALI